MLLKTTAYMMLEATVDTLVIVGFLMMFYILCQVDEILKILKDKNKPND